MWFLSFVVKVEDDIITGVALLVILSENADFGLVVVGRCTAVGIKLVAL